MCLGPLSRCARLGQGLGACQPSFSQLAMPVPASPGHGSSGEQCLLSCRLLRSLVSCASQARCFERYALCCPYFRSVAQRACVHKAACICASLCEMYLRHARQMKGQMRAWQMHICTKRSPERQGHALLLHPHHYLCFACRYMRVYNAAIKDRAFTYGHLLHVLLHPHHLLCLVCYLAATAIQQ